jgi:hypothetical protein
MNSRLEMGLTQTLVAVVVVVVACVVVEASNIQLSDGTDATTPWPLIGIPLQVIVSFIMRI